jgi:nucleotide-binding universal stress UspA family protein
MPVVAAIDRSERAKSVIERAKVLADDSALDLHIVHVGESTVPHYKSGYEPKGAEVISKQKAKGIARDIGQDVLGEDEFQPVGLQGDPASEILQYAAEHDAAYIVVSARKRSPLKQTVFGSVTQALLLSADRPVVSIPPESD